MKHNDEQGSKRSRDRSMDSDKKDHKVEEPAPKRRKDDSGQPSASSASTRNSPATGSSTLPRRPTQKPAALSLPSPSAAIRAIQEMQAGQRDAEKSTPYSGTARAGKSAAYSGTSRTQLPSVPAHTKPASSNGPSILSRNSASKIKPPTHTPRVVRQVVKSVPAATAPSAAASGDGSGQTRDRSKEVRLSKDDVLKATGADDRDLKEAREPEPEPESSTSGTGPVASTNAASSTDSKNASSTAATSSAADTDDADDLPPKIRPGEALQEFRKRQKEFYQRPPRPPPPFQSIPGEDSVVAYMRKEEHRLAMQRSTKKKSTPVHYFDLLDQQNKDEKDKAKESGKKDKVGEEARQHEGEHQASASGTGTADSSTGASAGDQSNTSSTNDTNLPPKRQPGETLEDFPRPKEGRQQKYRQKYKIGQKKPEQSGEKDKVGRKGDNGTKHQKSSVQKTQSSGFNYKAMPLINQDRDPASGIDFPKELFEKLKDLDVSVKDDYDSSALAAGYSANPVYIIVLEQNRRQAFFSVLATVHGMSNANHLALSLFRQEVPKLLPELRTCPGLGHEDEQEPLAQLHDRPDRNWTRTVWYKARGDIRENTRLAWYVDRDGEQKGLVTLSAALPRTEFQVTVKVIKHWMVLATS
ncbi:hypothetical protein PG994_013380 [Apiospora phragmitis]|uniref:Uncharacterized protein n=1 Tax=Apiospora phragmitis TaxID=2905665 RepID=A0ABR1T8H7_9PEZI